MTPMKVLVVDKEAITLKDNKTKQMRRPVIHRRVGLVVSKDYLV